MSFEVRLTPNARRDFDRHVAYFQSQDDLDLRIGNLEDDLLGTLAFIAEHPFLRREMFPGVRHESMRVFAFHVWYRTYKGADFIDVVAIVHHAVDRSQIETRL